MTDSYPKHTIGHTALESLWVIGFASFLYGFNISSLKPDEALLAISFGTLLIGISTGTIVYQKLLGGKE